MKFPLMARINGESADARRPRRTFRVQRPLDGRAERDVRHNETALWGQDGVKSGKGRDAPSEVAIAR